MTRAMVLCAGLGTRLRPLTHQWPKPAMPLLGKPLVRYAFEALLHAGVTEVGINTFHLPQVMEATARLECEKLGLKLSVARESGEIQGTGGGIRGLKEFLKTGESIILNGDVLFMIDPASVLAAHRASGAAATMVLLPMPDGEKYNPVELDAAQNVRRIAGHGPGGDRLTPWHFTGMHVLSPAVFGFFGEAGPEDINRDVYPRLLEAGHRIHGHVVDPKKHYWSDLGTPERYAATHRDLLFGQVQGFSFPEPKGAGNFHADPTAQLRDVRVAGPAWFGAGCELGDGVRIGSGVSVGLGATVGSGTSLNRVAVLDGASVPKGELLEDLLIAPGNVRVKLAAPAR